MSAVLSMRREREKFAFADRLAAIERMLKRGSVGEPEKLLAKLLTADEVAELLGLKLGTIRTGRASPTTSRRSRPTSQRCVGSSAGASARWNRRFAATRRSRTCAAEFRGVERSASMLARRLRL